MDYSRLDKEKSNSAKKNRTHVKTSVFLDRIGAYDRLYGDELRAERFYRQEEDAAVRLRAKPQPFQCKEVMKNTKPVIQRQVHPSFLPESYLEAEGMFTLPAELSAQIEEYARDNGGRMPENSDILRTALVQYAGVPDSNDPNSALGEGIDYVIENQAHHIVEINAPEALRGRQILSAAEINLNSAANGVLLPTHGSDTTGEATVHMGSHIKEYADCVNRALDGAVTGLAPRTQRYQDNVLKRLAQIRRVLLTSNGALNGRGDSDYNPLTQGPKTLTEIFEENGLFLLP